MATQSLNSLKAYRDFPWLWAVHPACGWNVQVNISTLSDGEMFSRPFPQGAVLWTKSSFEKHERVIRIELDPTVNLAQNIIRAYELSICYEKITHLILDHGSENSVRLLSVIRPPKNLSIAQMCINRAASIQETE